MNKRKVLFLLAIILVAGLWYLFRPELLFVTTKVDEALPATESDTAAPTALLSGRFHGVAHETEGLATVYRLANGDRVLRLSEFRTSNGPDVQVYLVASPEAEDSETVTEAGFISLGALKGTEGDQNYELPPDIDLERYRSVTIWCARFSVNFGSAPLTGNQT